MDSYYQQTFNYQRPTSQMGGPSLLDVYHGEDVELCEAKNYQLEYESGN